MRGSNLPSNDHRRLWVPAFAGMTMKCFVSSPAMTAKNFVNAMFTTFMRVRFTNVFE
jgi:hypothetical protein